MSVWLIVYLGILGACTLEIIVEYAVYDYMTSCRCYSDLDYSKLKRLVYTPKDIYNRSYINWFGCIFCYILLLLFTPHLMLLKWLIPATYKSVYWIFHVGRCGDCSKCKYWVYEEIPGGVHKVCIKPERSSAGDK